MMTDAAVGKVENAGRILQDMHELLSPSWRVYVDDLNRWVACRTGQYGDVLVVADHPQSIVDVLSAAWLRGCRSNVARLFQNLHNLLPEWAEYEYDERSVAYRNGPYGEVWIVATDRQSIAETLSAAWLS